MLRSGDSWMKGGFLEVVKSDGLCGWFLWCEMGV